MDKINKGNMMKKILVMAAFLAAIFALSGCGGDSYYAAPSYQTEGEKLDQAAKNAAKLSPQQTADLRKLEK